MNPRDTLPPWKESTALDRANSSRAFLLLHEFITNAESAKIRKRILKWMENSNGEPSR